MTRRWILPICYTLRRNTSTHNEYNQRFDLMLALKIGSNSSQFWLQAKIEYTSEVESSRTFLASRTHFEVLGSKGHDLGFSKPQVLEIALFSLRGQHYFLYSWNCWKTPETSQKSCEDLFCFPPLKIARKNFLKTFFRLEIARNFFEIFFFRRTLALVACIFGFALKHSYFWPREGLSSEGLSLASDFFLCPWPSPRALTRLHLWYTSSTWKIKLRYKWSISLFRKKCLL